MWALAPDLVSFGAHILGDRLTGFRFKAIGGDMAVFVRSSVRLAGLVEFDRARGAVVEYESDGLECGSRVCHVKFLVSTPLL